MPGRVIDSAYHGSAAYARGLSPIPILARAFACRPGIYALGAGFFAGFLAPKEDSGICLLAGFGDYWRGLFLSVE